MDSEDLVFTCCLPSKNRENRILAIVLRGPFVVLFSGEVSPVASTTGRAVSSGIAGTQNIPIALSFSAGGNKRGKFANGG